MLIRAAAAEDEADWRALWDSYVAFYEAQVSEAVTALTWRRALDPASPVFIRLAEREGAIAGFSVSVLHLGTWVAEPVCYLEDLFVAPAARGAGLGKALIEDLIALGDEKGWRRLYWHTREDNGGARTLYDHFVAADDYVRYRLSLPRTER